MLSTVTPAGHALAREKLRGKCQVIYAPLDFSWVARKYVDMLNPALYISTETEIWPNLFTCLQKRNIPIIEVNGRISDQGVCRIPKSVFPDAASIARRPAVVHAEPGGRATDHSTGRG